MQNALYILSIVLFLIGLIFNKPMVVGLGLGALVSALVFFPA